MEGSSGSIWFLGTPADDWSQSIAEALQGCSNVSVRRFDEGVDPDFPALAGPADVPLAMILHRPRLALGDADRWARARSSDSPSPRTRKILCHGEFVRQAELERWASLVDDLIPEAVAPDLLPARVAALVGPNRNPAEPSGSSIVHHACVRVVGGDGALIDTLVEACRSRGYIVEVGPARRESTNTPSTLAAHSPRPITIWEAALLESNWAGEIERTARTGPVIALIAFPRREMVALAKEQGATACLPLPVRLDDLMFILDRTIAGEGVASITAPAVPAELRGATRPEPPHSVPPRPARARSRTTGLRATWSAAAQDPTILDRDESDSS